MFCLAGARRSPFTRDRPQVLSAVLRPLTFSAATWYLGNPGNLEANRDACMSELLACTLEHCEAAEQAGEGTLGMDCAEVFAITKP